MAGQWESNVTPRRAVFMEVPEPYQSIASYMSALQDAEPPALRAFYVMYAPLLRDQARRVGVHPDNVDDLVTTVLGDVLLHLQATALPPRDLARYVVGALRNHARNDHRDRVRRCTREEQAYSTQGHGGQRIVAECHSEYGIHVAQGTDHDGTPPLNRALRRLAEYSAQAMGAEDAALMIGVSRHVPLRDLAAQAGLSYGNTRVRVHRLREKFGRLVRQYALSLDAEERREVERFLRRAGVTLHVADDEARSPEPRRRPMPAPGVTEEGDT